MKSLDPKNPLHKPQIKAQIVESIANEFSGADRGKIAEQVEREYERLLAGALVVSHIPSLTTGSVRRHVRRHAEAGAASVPAAH